MIYSLFFTFFLLSCASKPPEEKLFPFGIYHHQVSLERSGRLYKFTGVNKWDKEQISLVALGPFDSTLLRYTEDLNNHKQELFSNYDFLPISDEKAKFYLSYVKNIYSLDRSSCQYKICRKSLNGFEFIFMLDELNQVEYIKFQQGDFKIDIQVVDFEKIL